MNHHDLFYACASLGPEGLQVIGVSSHIERDIKRAMADGCTRRRTEPLTAKIVGSVYHHISRKDGPDTSWEMYWWAEQRALLRKRGWLHPVVPWHRLYEAHRIELEREWRAYWSSVHCAIGESAARSAFRVKRTLAIAEDCPPVRVLFHTHMDVIQTLKKATLWTVATACVVGTLKMLKSP